MLYHSLVAHGLLLGAMASVVIATYFLRDLRGGNIVVTLISFVCGGALVYFSAKFSREYVSKGPNGLDLWYLNLSAWRTVLAFVGFTIAINYFFMLGLNATETRNKTALIVVWVACLTVVPLMLEWIEKGREFWANFSPGELIGCLVILGGMGIYFYSKLAD